MPSDRAVKPKRCVVCGCTDDDCSQCVALTGEPCHWVENAQDLCSSCDRLAAALRQAYRWQRTSTRLDAEER